MYEKVKKCKNMYENIMRLCENAWNWILNAKINSK